jgi:hypothetical protein
MKKGQKEMTLLKGTRVSGYLDEVAQHEYPEPCS